MPILAALAHLDKHQRALGIDVVDPRHDDVAAAQAGAKGDAERSLVLETRTWPSVDQRADLIAPRPALNLTCRPSALTAARHLRGPSLDSAPYFTGTATLA
jgi:hypothetical protein